MKKREHTLIAKVVCVSYVQHTMHVFYVLNVGVDLVVFSGLCVCVCLCCVLCGLKAWFIHVPPPLSCPALSAYCGAVFSLAGPEWIPWGPCVCGVCVCLFVWFVCVYERTREWGNFWHLLFYKYLCVWAHVFFVCLCVYVVYAGIPRVPSDCVLSPLIWITMSGGMQAVCFHPTWITQNELSFSAQHITVSPDVLWPAPRVCLCPTW